MACASGLGIQKTETGRLEIKFSLDYIAKLCLKKTKHTISSILVICKVAKILSSFHSEEIVHHVTVTWLSNWAERRPTDL